MNKLLIFFAFILLQSCSYVDNKIEEKKYELRTRFNYKVIATGYFNDDLLVDSLVKFETRKTKQKKFAIIFNKQWQLFVLTRANHDENYNWVKKVNVLPKGDTIFSRIAEDGSILADEEVPFYSKVITTHNAILFSGKDDECGSEIMYFNNGRFNLYPQD